MKIDGKKILGFARSVAIGMATSAFFGAVDQYARTTVQEFLKKRKARIESETDHADNTTSTTNINQ